MLPFRSGRSAILGAWLAFFSILILDGRALSAEKNKAAPKKNAGATPSPEEAGLTNIPLPVGHTAKGLTLPDFDLDGHLLGRLEAGTAKRLDLEHVQLTSLKVTTFTPENQVDLIINMSDSILNLRTRILTSEKPTTIDRADFKIVSNAVKFDTVSRETTMIGNVKMVLHANRSQTNGKEAAK